MNRGYLLIELLVAVSLFSLAGSGLYSGFQQGLVAHQRIRASFEDRNPARIAFLRIERDLRNTIPLRDYPFKGKREEITFPVAFEEVDENLKLGTQLYRIRYFIKQGSLWRSQETLGSKRKLRTESQDRILVKNLEEVEFSFPYQDADQEIQFLNFWLEEPSLGIPRAVKLQWVTNKRDEEQVHEKLISLPQGKWGTLPGGSEF